MTPQQAERIVMTTMRLLAVAFAVTGILFIATPDGVVSTIDDAGAELGEFAPGADTDQKLWLGLAFAYMVLVTGIALLVGSDVARFRPLLLLLAAGKAASSLTAGAFFLLDEDVFVYLLNFLVDGGLVLVALGCWALSGRVEGRDPAAGHPGAGTALGDGGGRGREERSEETPVRPA